MGVSLLGAVRCSGLFRRQSDVAFRRSLLPHHQFSTSFPSSTSISINHLPFTMSEQIKEAPNHSSSANGEGVGQASGLLSTSHFGALSSTSTTNTTSAAAGSTGDASNVFGDASNQPTAASAASASTAGGTTVSAPNAPLFAYHPQRHTIPYSEMVHPEVTHNAFLQPQFRQEYQQMMSHQHLLLMEALAQHNQAQQIPQQHQQPQNSWAFSTTAGFASIPIPNFQGIPSFNNSWSLRTAFGQPQAQPTAPVARAIVQQPDYDSEDDEGKPYGSRRLIYLVEEHHWMEALQRISTHPNETSMVGIQGRTPLHVACDNDAPAFLIHALLCAWPEGAERVGTSLMNPLHITCSSTHASNEIVNLLLAGCRNAKGITGAKDVDGDTPLHAACRCAAPMDVLVTLLQANPTTVLWKDYEGLNPLMRLWVRYYVILGEQIISSVNSPGDLTIDLMEAWQKSFLLLQVMSEMDKKQARESEGAVFQRTPFRAVHAASAVECPRCVVRFATILFPQELMVTDEHNRLPLHIASSTPIYAVHDLGGEGFTIDDAFLDDANELSTSPRLTEPRAKPKQEKEDENQIKEPSVIDILLSGNPSAACVPAPNGQLPLHSAIMMGKTLQDGVLGLIDAYPESLTVPDCQTNLYPFQLAASIGRDRGDTTTIFELLVRAPDLVKTALTKEWDKTVVDEDLDQKPKAKVI